MSAADMKLTLGKAGRNCKTIGALSPQEIVSKGIAQLRKLKAIKVKGKKITVRKAHIIDYFAAVVMPQGNDI
jgi:hypothetical protein